MKDFTTWKQEIWQDIEGIGRKLEPDDDWTPVVLMESDKVRTVMPINHLLDSADHKEVLARALPMVMKKVRPAYAAMVVLSWMLTRPATLGREEVDHLQETGIADHPDRTEVLMVRFCDGQTEEFWAVPITRTSDAPPQLGERELFKGPFEGRFGHVLLDAMKAAKA